MLYCSRMFVDTVLIITLLTACSFSERATKLKKSLSRITDVAEPTRTKDIDVLSNGLSPATVGPTTGEGESDFIARIYSNQRNRKRKLTNSKWVAGHPMRTALQPVPVRQRQVLDDVRQKIEPVDDRSGLPRSKSAITQRTEESSHRNRKNCLFRHGQKRCGSQAAVEKSNELPNVDESVAATSNSIRSSRGINPKWYGLDMEELRNKLKELRQQRLAAFLRRERLRELEASGHPPVKSDKNDEKRNELISAGNVVDPEHDFRVRPRFYPDDGPKRDWRVNLMRVWG